MKFLQFMRNLDSSQQVAALFVVVFGLLLLVSATRFALSVRERRVEPSAAQLAFSADFGALLRVTWIMAGVLGMVRTRGRCPPPSQAWMLCSRMPAITEI